MSCHICFMPSEHGRVSLFNGVLVSRNQAHTMDLDLNRGRL